jgi:hypothetical protein
VTVASFILLGYAVVVTIVVAWLLTEKSRAPVDNAGDIKVLHEANEILTKIVKERDVRYVEDQRAFTRQMNVILARDDRIAKLEEQIAYLKKVNDGLLRVSRVPVPT